MFGLSAEAHVALGSAFLVVGLVAAGLQYWLWTFPMAPDPTGADPNGRTTAPVFWRMTHRALGYLFAGIYVVMVASMVPRVWRYVDEAWNPVSVAHAAAATGVLLVLVPKVMILRRWQKFGKRLPLLGSLLLLLAGIIAGTGAAPYAALRMRPRPAGMSEPDFQATISHIANRCTQCHGLSRVMGESDDREEWGDILEEMSENAEDMGRPDPVGGQAAAIAAVLADDDGRDDDAGRRRRRRGRGGRASDRPSVGLLGRPQT